MINAAKAYLKTEGTVDYRECKICYYTYSMFDHPNQYKVNVNVDLQHTQNYYTKTLSLDETFDKENLAINYGIEQGKKFIDRSYELGKVSIVKTEPAIKVKNSKDLKPNKSKTDKPKLDKK